MGTDSQDSDDLVPPGTTGMELDTSSIQVSKSLLESPTTTNLGIKNAKKKLRAFSIQKKTAIAPVVVPKPVNTGSTTVLIGRLSSVKTTPKPEPEPDAKKIPKPPKPGGTRRNIQELQKRTLAEIEDMKRKMELVELGIPLGLIDPAASRDKGMPTKAMPPIKSFLDATKVDELIREAKKARAEGREFKFDYQKLLPDYDNPFQRKKDDPNNPQDQTTEEERPQPKVKLVRKSYKKIERYDRRYEHKKDDRDKDRHREKDNKHKEKEKDKHIEEVKKVDEEKLKEKPKETDVNLNDYLVCDSWSLDNDDKNTASPTVDGKKATILQLEKVKQAAILVKETLKMARRDDDITVDSPKSKPKVEKLQPVIDSFKFEIDPNEDDPLDLFDEDLELEKFARPTIKKDPYESPIDLKLFDYDQDMSKEGVIDANDDNFLESVINEIKQENMSDDGSQEKGLVEYDLSPKDDYDDSKNDVSQGSVTPELDDRMRDLQSSQHSHYSDSYMSTESGYTSKSTESGYKSTESGYKSNESGYKPAESGYKPAETGYMPAESGHKLKRRGKSKEAYRSESRQSDDFRLSIEKELDDAMKVTKMSKSTVDSLETWSFVLKICQPLLFRHDKNKCYKQTHVSPKIWYTENPKGCSCVKDRSVVYEELEMCKMGLVDRVYGCDQIPDEPFPNSRTWYPRITDDSSSAGPPLASEWETEDAHELDCKSLTPQHDGQDLCLDREYQKFMEAVWPDAADKPPDTSRSTTPVRQEARKKKKPEDLDKEEDRKRAKKPKLSCEGWSQESDFEDEAVKTKKIKQEKSRKRKHSSSSGTTLSDSDDEARKKKKIVKKKGPKKLKAKLAKKRRINKKLKKHLKDKQKKKKRLVGKIQEVSDDTDELKEKKKEKKIKKKKQVKPKKLLKKKKIKVKSSSSSSSSSSSETESDEPKKIIKKKEVAVKKAKKEKKRSKSTDSSQSEELFDVNVLNNIKTERVSEDEMAFSPRRKPREIINVKELQKDFVGSNISIKQEKLDEPKKEVMDCSEMQEFAVEKPLEEEKQKLVAAAKKPEVTAEEKVKVKTNSVEKVKERSIPEFVPPVTPQTKSITIDLAKKPMAPFKIENYMIPLPSDPIMPYSLDDIAMPPDPIETVAPSKIEPIVSKSEPVTSKFEPISSKFKPIGSQIESITSNIEPTVANIEPKISNIEPIRPSIQPIRSNVEPLRSNIEPIMSNIEPIMSNIEPVTSNIESISSNIESISSTEFNFESASQNELYGKGIEAECEDKFADAYAPDNYEMYEHMAMAYQSDVANQQLSGVVIEPVAETGSTQKIETVVRRRGEIKCDWRAGDSPASTGQHHRPSRWGLKPGDVNIVLTGGPSAAVTSDAGSQQFRIRSVLEPVYEIRSIANRTDNTTMGYDEAYMDMYGAMDRLQYGDCFGDEEPRPPRVHRQSALDRRISRALQETVLGEVAKETDDKETPDKGILVTNSLAVGYARGKRVSFADGYRPGQDSDTEEPPAKKKKKSRRYGCAWPCPASHPDHVPLWDALPPPPPPPSPPPPPAPAPPPLHLLRPRARPRRPEPRTQGKDPMALPQFMPPEPPPGLINFQ